LSRKTPASGKFKILQKKSSNLTPLVSAFKPTGSNASPLPPLRSSSKLPKSKAKIDVKPSRPPSAFLLEKSRLNKIIFDRMKKEEKVL
jgi:hypothetical protein